MSFLKRSVVIGWRSIPLGVILALVVVVTVFAAWILAGSVYSFVTPAAGVSGGWIDPSAVCTLIDNQGYEDASITNCWHNGTDGGPTIALANMRPGMIYEVAGDFQNTGTTEVCLQAIDLSSLPVFLETANFNASVDPIPPAGIATITLNATVSDLLIAGDPEQSFSVNAEWFESPVLDGLCP